MKGCRWLTLFTEPVRRAAARAAGQWTLHIRTGRLDRSHAASVRARTLQVKCSLDLAGAGLTKLCRFERVARPHFSSASKALRALKNRKCASPVKISACVLAPDNYWLLVYR